MRRVELLIAVVVGALVVVGVADAAKSGSEMVVDKRADSKALKRKPELDIRRASASDEAGRRVKHKISMQGTLTPEKKFTRPFLLINTKGGSKSEFEYLALGPRLFKRKGDGFVEGRRQPVHEQAQDRIYRFKPARIGLRPGDSYGWAALTSKGKAVDLAPNSRYVTHEVGFIPTTNPSGPPPESGREPAPRSAGSSRVGPTCGFDSIARTGERRWS